jgi:DNA-binding transcriptional LysR family regulator
LQYFLVSAETLNLSRAAERLGVGQPTMSQAIRRLEAGIGTKLFDRYKTGVRLTPSGKRLLTHGRSALEEWSKLKKEVLSANAAIEGKYSLGCHVSLGLYTLPVFLGALLSEHPGLEIQLAHAVSRVITEEIISFRLDFGIVANPAKHPDLVIKELCRDEVGYWVAKGGDTRTLVYDPSLTQSRKLVSQIDAKNPIFSRWIESSSLELIASLAETGCGVAILTERVARKFPKLRPFRPELPRYPDRICLIYRADRKISTAARAIIDKISSAKF